MSVEQGLSTSVRQREVETVEFNRDQGFGITLYLGQRKGSASTSASGAEAIRETVAAALAIARHTSEDECSGLADAALMAKEIKDFDLFHEWNITPEQAIERALICEAAAFEADSRIKNADGTTLSTPEHVPGVPGVRQQPWFHRRFRVDAPQPQLRDDRRR